MSFNTILTPSKLVSLGRKTRRLSHARFEENKGEGTLDPSERHLNMNQDSVRKASSRDVKQNSLNLIVVDLLEHLSLPLVRREIRERMNDICFFSEIHSLSLVQVGEVTLKVI